MDLPAYSDEALVAVIQSGGDNETSAQAFGLLLERTLPVLHARVDSAVRRAQGGRLVSREDLFQEGMLGFLSAVSSYQPDRNASFRTYASVCVNHRVISALRRSAKAWEEALPDDNLIPGTRSMDPQDIFSAMEETRRIMEAVQSQLSRLERSVIEGYLAGERYEVIAQRLGVPVKSVDNALQRVRKKLRKFL